MHSRPSSFSVVSLAAAGLLSFACSNTIEDDSQPASYDVTSADDFLEAEPHSYDRFGGKVAATDELAVVGAREHNVTPGVSNSNGG